MLGGDPADMSSQLSCAVRIAKRLGTSLTGLTVMPDPASSLLYVPAADMMPAGAEVLHALKDNQRQAREKLRSEFNLAMENAGHGFQAVYRDEMGSVAYRTAGAAMLSSAMVIPRTGIRAEPWTGPR